MRVENVTQTKAKKTDCYPFKHHAYSFILYLSIFGARPCKNLTEILPRSRRDLYCPRDLDEI